jgi:hypothetical protein
MMQDEVLAEIASMCSKRILHRLRLVAGRRGKPKQPIQAALRTAIRGLKEVGNHFLSKHLPLSVAFVEKAKEAIRYADAWINHQTMPRLYDLVKAIHSLKHTGDIEAMLAILPTQVMDPSMGRNIVNILDKVARYYDASRLLVRMSKKHEVIRRLKIVVVELPQSVWARPNDGVPNRTLASVFSQVSINSQNSSLAQVIRTLDITQTEANELFMAQTRKTMCEAKIHAEVQLVYYCELSPTKQPPRIIASNKDACYLCNAFMEMYGKLHTSRSHGRLYPGWRLPVIPNLRQMEETFTAVLEARIRASMATSLSRRCKTIYPYPNESTLLSLVHSESTIVGGVGEGVEDLEELARLSVSGSSSSFSDSKSSIGREECKTATLEGANQEADSRETSTVEPVSSTTRKRHDLRTYLEDCEDRDERMVQGRTTVARYNKTICIGAELELHLQPPERSSPGSNPQTFEYSLEWVAAEKLHSSKAPGAASIIDLEQLKQEKTFELDNKDQLLIGVREIIIQISRSGKNKT